MANEKRLIDADALLGRLANSSESWAKNIKAIRNWWPHAVGIKDNIVSLIKDAPTVDARPVVHGRWEKEDQSGISIDGYMVCSACNVMIPKPDDNRYCLNRLNFCPNCGADMRGDRDG